MSLTVLSIALQDSTKFDVLIMKLILSEITLMSVIILFKPHFINEAFESTVLLTRNGSNKAIVIVEKLSQKSTSTGLYGNGRMFIFQMNLTFIII
jgi:hypothetical protein